MSVELKIKFNGMSNIVSRINKYIDKLDKPTPMFKKMAILGFKDVIDHFDKESGPRGKWKPLNMATVKSRRQGKKKNRGPKILQDTGVLRNSMKPSSGKIRTQKDRVILYTDIVYAAAHNFGTDKLPQREFMWISPRARKSIINVVQQHIKR